MINLQFLSFFLAYLILVLLSIPVFFLGIFAPQWQPIADSVGIVMNFLSALLNFLNIILFPTIMKKNKWLFILLLALLIFNLANVFY